MKHYPLFVFIFLIKSLALSQPVDLTYYLPQDVSYNPAIPKPSTVLGFEVGEMHGEYHPMLTYYQTLAEASPRITLEVYARSYEQRPLIMLTITSENNQERIDALKAQHQRLSDPASAQEVSVEEAPVVVWMGYSVHGNEPSGTNAAMLVAYYLAAAQGPSIDSLLDNSIILIDPFINPDGMNRFATWVNSRKSLHLSTDPHNIEQNEPWPRGRTNHYWFDLNRDWLLLQHPESRGRLVKFHEWKPNVLTDHHEMGTDATLFFQPGVPSRENPNTPASTFILTEQLGKYHAKGLDAIGSLYYTQENYDDFFYGKGSTYPDVNGGVGILFEQASSRSHAQESENGILTFPFTIRNQFTVSLTTLQGALAMKKELLTHQRNFYQEALAEAAEDPVKAYVFAIPNDPARLYHFTQLLQQHQIAFYQSTQDITQQDSHFPADQSYVVPMAQKQYHLIKALFEKNTTFDDSLFYDISAWTMPLAFDLNYAPLTQRALHTGEEVDSLAFPQGTLIGGKSEYAYVFEPDGYYAHRAIYRLLKAGLNLKVATDTFSDAQGRKFDYGTILLPLSIQEEATKARIDSLIEKIVTEDGITVYNASTGLNNDGISLGSGKFVTLKKPEIALLIEGGVNSYDAGEVWHLLDQRFQIPVTLLSIEKFNQVELDRYNVLVMVDGSYREISTEATEKLKQWVQKGNTLIAMQEAGKWLSDRQMGGFRYKKIPADSASRRPFASREAYQGAQVIGGAIFEARLDVTHPIAYGYDDENISLFRSNSLFMEPASNPYVHPVMYTEEPLLSGYISEEKEDLLRGTAAVGVANFGKGVVINFTDNPNFRAFWFGTNKLFMNSLFFGHIMR